MQPPSCMAKLLCCYLLSDKNQFPMWLPMFSLLFLPSEQVQGQCQLQNSYLKEERVLKYIQLSP